MFRGVSSGLKGLRRFKDVWGGGGLQEFRVVYRDLGWFRVV